MCSKQAQWDPYWAPGHRPVQNGTLTTSGLLKCGNLMKMLRARTRTVDDKFVIMLTWTLTPHRIEPFQTRSFLSRVRKILDLSSKDAMQDIDKRSVVWWMFVSSTLEASVFNWKESLRHFTSNQKYRERSHFKTDDRHVWKVDNRTIRWDFWSVSN